MSETVSIQRQTRSIAVAPLGAVALGAVLPAVAYIVLARAGLDIAPAMAVVVGCSLAFSAVLVLVEGITLGGPATPPMPAEAPPPATVIVLAEEADPWQILYTLAALLRLDAQPQRIVLCCTQSHAWAIAREIQAAIADGLPLIVREHVPEEAWLECVRGALSAAEGEIVAVLQAGQEPAAGNLSRAWQWLSGGCDAVQGHAVVREAGSTWVGRISAVDGEAPDSLATDDVDAGFRTNTYWRIGSLIKAFDGTLGKRPVVALDRCLAVTEDRPLTIRAFWRQRLTWAGWWQRAGSGGESAARRASMSRIRLLDLSVWRPIQAWVGIQVLPLLAYAIWRFGGIQGPDVGPIVILGLLYAFSTSLIGTAFAYRRAVPEVRSHKGWFLEYAVLASLLLTTLDKLAYQVVQLRDLFRWVPAPRPAAAVQEPAASYPPEPEPTLVETLDRSTGTSVMTPAPIPEGRANRSKGRELAAQITSVLEEVALELQENEVERKAADAREMLRSSSGPLNSEHVRALEDVTDALLRDVVKMMQIAQQATGVASLVHDYVRLHRLLEDAGIPAIGEAESLVLEEQVESSTIDVQS